MIQFNNNPWAPQKIAALSMTGRGSNSQFGAPGVIDRSNPNSGYSYPGPRNTTGSTPSPYVRPPNTPSAPGATPHNPMPGVGDWRLGGPIQSGTPPSFFDQPPQLYNSALHGTAVDAASKGAFGPSQPTSYGAPTNPGAYQSNAYVYHPPGESPIDPPGQDPNPYSPVPVEPTQPQQLSREDWRDKWMSSGISNIEGLKQFLAQYGGELLSGNGTARTPFGEIYDLLIGARSGQGTPGWTPVNPYATEAAAPTSLEIPGLKDLLDQIAKLSQPTPGMGDVKLGQQPRSFSNAYGPQQWNPINTQYNPNLLSGLI